MRARSGWLVGLWLAQTVPVCGVEPVVHGKTDEDFTSRQFVGAHFEAAVQFCSDSLNQT